MNSALKKIKIISVLFILSQFATAQGQKSQTEAGFNISSSSVNNDFRNLEKQLRNLQTIHPESEKKSDQISNVNLKNNQNIQLFKITIEDSAKKKLDRKKVNSKSGNN